MAKYIIYNTLAEAQAGQVLFDQRLGYRDGNGDAMYSTTHAFPIIKHPTQDLWAISLEPVSGVAAAAVEIRGKVLPLEALSGKAIIRDITGDNVTIKTEAQMRNDEWFIMYDQGEPVEGTF